MSTHRKQELPANFNSGGRAEEIALWYLRLNGFFSIPGFVLHSGDHDNPVISEADVLAMRMPFSREEIRGIWMTDERWVRRSTDAEKPLFLITEVKADLCSVNGPWTDKTRRGMERVIRRLGMLQSEDDVTKAAQCMYDRLRWENETQIIQYLCIGKRPHHQLRTRFPDLVQLTWAEIAEFLYERFRAFGKLKGHHPQWGVFGQQYARAIEFGQIASAQHSIDAVCDYLTTGQFLSKRCS